MGSGIGLLLVKSYVTLHGGKVEFDSEENRESSFRIIIPYKEVPETSETLASLTTNVIPPEVTGNFSTTLFTSGEKMLHILVVEDNTDLQEFLQKSLEGTY